MKRTNTVVSLNKPKSSRRKYSPLSKIGKLVSPSKFSTKAVGVDDIETGYKLNSLRTKRHVSPKSKLPKETSKEKSIGSKKVRSNISQDFLGISKKLSRRKNILVPRFAEVNFDISDYSTKMKDRRRKISNKSKDSGRNFSKKDYLTGKYCDRIV